MAGATVPVVAAWGAAAFVLLLVAFWSYLAPDDALRLLNHPPIGRATTHVWTAPRVNPVLTLVPGVMFALLYVSTGSVGADCRSRDVRCDRNRIHVAGTGSAVFSLAEARGSAAMWLRVAAAGAR